MLKTQMIQELKPWFKALIYGPPGVGKTTWAYENAPNPHWLDFEQSTETLKAIGATEVPITNVGPDNNPQEVVSFVKSLVLKGEAETIVFDTISSSQLFQLTYEVAKSNHDLALIQDYRVSTTYFSDLFFWLQHQPINVILIAHEKEHWEGELGNKKKIAIGPSVTPALHDAVRQLVNAVLRYDAIPKGLGKNAVIDHREMMCHSQGLYVAKNRYNVQETIVSDPTWQTFMK